LVESSGRSITELHAVVKTLQGACAVWYNLMLSGEGDYDTRHAACPVLSGSKWSMFHCMLVKCVFTHYC